MKLQTMKLQKTLAIHNIRGSILIIVLFFTMLMGGVGLIVIQYVQTIRGQINTVYYQTQSYYIAQGGVELSLTKVANRRVAGNIAISDDIVDKAYISTGSSLSVHTNNLFDTGRIKVPSNSSKTINLYGYKNDNGEIPVIPSEKFVTSDVSLGRINGPTSDCNMGIANSINSTTNIAGDIQNTDTCYSLSPNSVGYDQSKNNIITFTNTSGSDISVDLVGKNIPGDDVYITSTGTFRDKTSVISIIKNNQGGL